MKACKSQKSLQNMKHTKHMKRKFLTYEAYLQHSADNKTSLKLHLIQRHDMLKYDGED